MENLFTIGKLSKISGVSTRTIRHYEDIGILFCTGNTKAKYRLYSEREIERLELILLFKSLGFSLSDIKIILSTNDNSVVASLFSRQFFEVEKNIMENLKDSDPDFAGEVMKAMFTFDDIPALADVTIQKWLVKCSDDELATALKDSRKHLKERIFSNMNAERANIIKEKIANATPRSLDEIFSSMSNLINTLREMEADGSIVIHRLEK